VTQSSYLGAVLTPDGLRDAAAKVSRRIEQLEAEKGYKIDAIAFRGMSGALVGPMAATFLNKGMLLVRKPGDGSHSDYTVEGMILARKYVIVDDFVSTGVTVSAIRAEIVKYSVAVLVGVIAYRTHGSEVYEKCLTPTDKVYIYGTG